MAGGSTKVIIISLCANFGIACSKLAGALFTGSAALMAEAVHSFSDCGNQGLLLYGGHAANRPASKRFPLGRGKEQFFWSFVVALLLFSMGGIFSLYEGVHKIQHEGALEYPLVAIAILVVAIGLEGFSFWACLKEVRHQYPKGSLWVWIKETTAADLLVIFLEDFAALLGLVLALVALLAAWATGNSLWDGIGSCAIGVLLIGTAIVLAREVKPMLIGESPALDYEKAVRDVLAAQMPEAELLSLIAMQVGVGKVLLAYKVKPADLSHSAGSVIDAVNALEASVKARYPEVVWQFAELDTKI